MNIQTNVGKRKREAPSYHPFDGEPAKENPGKGSPEDYERELSPPRDACDTGGFSSAGQQQVLSADRK